MHDEDDEQDELVRSGQAAAPWTTIGAVIEKQAARYGDKVAVIFPDMAQLTYAEVETLSRTIGQGMLARGVRPGDRVASMIRNSPGQLLIWLAAARIGAVAVPANISLAVSDLAHVITECRPSWFVTEPKYQDTVIQSASLAGQIDPARIAVVDPTAVAGPGSLASVFPGTDEQLPQVEPSDPVAVLFTGGTTGLPKAVLKAHMAYICAAQRYREVFEPVDGDCHLSATHLFHCGGQEIGFFGPFANGVRSVLPAWFSASGYWGLARRYGATLGEVLPTMMSILMSATPSDEDRDHRMRTAIGRGYDKPAFEDRFGIRVLPVFGMTEAGTLLVTNHRNDEVPSSCGYARDWCEISIRDPHDRLMPRGEVGELCLRPTLPFSMSLGYLGRAEATVERWQNLWLHTGDMARQDEQGALFIVGRQAHWIRRRGENVSVLEVEQVLNAHPSVAECAVAGFASELGEDDIRAFIVVGDGEAVTAAELDGWCKKHLAYFKAPASYVLVSELPKSAAKGEIERHKLVPEDGEALGW
jgi:crotonobetaine/carnitine-CoA ligase